jgi:hypothetical protein
LGADAEAQDSSPLDRRLQPCCVARPQKLQGQILFLSGDLSKIDMRMDLVRDSDLVLCSAAVIDTAYVL